MNTWKVYGLGFRFKVLASATVRTPSPSDLPTSAQKLGVHCFRETVRLLKRLHQWDVLRANKAPFAWGVETRVPFLDKAFLDLVMNIDPQEKMVRCCRKKSPRTLRCCTERCCTLAKGRRLHVLILQHAPGRFKC